MRLYVKEFAILLAASLCAVGCKKQQTEAAPPVGGVGAADASAAASSNSPPSLADVGGGGPSGTAEVLPGLDTASMAIQRNDYVSATLALVKMDTKEMSSEDLAKRAQMMRKLQGSVAQGAAAGDPRAIEAGNIMRASSMK